MTENELNQEYFDWMYQIVCDDRYSRHLSYRKLLGYLFDREFVYTIPMDGNRAEDGIALRYSFGYEKSYHDAVIASMLDIRPCSILEMMVALSLRCEEHIMSDPDIGNRTGQWFWNMINNLGLGTMNDERFDLQQVEDVITRWLNHEYAPDGKGGLFTVHHTRQDLRSVEIWYQMNWYLNEIV